MNDKLKLTNKTKYWLYVLTKANYEEYKKYKGNYITFMNGEDMKQGDIIFIFNKERLNSGFVGIVQLKNKAVINKNSGFVGLLKLKEDSKDKNDTMQSQKIFKDNNLNRDYAELSYKKIS